MNKRNLLRAIIWLVLIAGLSVITYYNNKLFITNSVKKDISAQEQKKIELEQDIKIIENKIKDYNEFMFEDNRYLSFIPNGYDSQDVLLNYVITPLKRAEAKLLSPISIIDEMPSNIDWSRNINRYKLQSKKISISFNIAAKDLDNYFNILQSSVRCIYIGDFHLTHITSSYPDGEGVLDYKVDIDYYIFYHDNHK